MRRCCSNLRFLFVSQTKFVNVTVFTLSTVTKRNELNIDQVPAGGGHVLHGTVPDGSGLLLLFLQVFLVLVVLVPNRLRAAVRVAVVVEEASEGELVEGVLRVACVQAARAVAGAVVAVVAAAPALVWLHRVEVGRVGGMSDGGHVGRRLLSRVA